MRASDVVSTVTIRAVSDGVAKAATDAEKLAQAGERVARVNETIERSSLDAGKGFERLSRDIDLAYRQQQNFERGQRILDRALSTSKISVEAYDRSMGLLTAKYGPASVAADRFGASVKTSNANVGGIAAQFQDVAVQLAGGQSPFLIALQQGTQLSGQLEQTGGGVKALGAAFLSLFSPMSLLTIGGIAAFGTLVQYISSAAGQTETLDQRLEKHADVIRSIKTAYGEAAEGIDKYASESARVLDLQLRTVTDKVKAGVQQAAREIGALTTTTIVPGVQFGLPEDLITKTFEANSKFSAFKDAVVTLRQELDTGTVNIARFRDEVARVASSTSDTGVQKLASELLAISENAFRAEQALGGSARAIGVLANAASSGLVALNGFNAALRTLQMGVPEMAKALTAQKDLTEANDSYRKGLADAKIAESAGGMTERAAAAATETYSRRVRDLNEAFQQRVRTITGANDLEKDFGKTLQTTVIAGLEDEARGIATARAAYEERNQKIADSIKLGMSDAEATGLRAQNEKILAQELKNVAAANKDKGSSGGSTSGGADAYDNATARIRDQIEELKQQQEQASKTTVEIYKLTEANRLRRAANQAGRGDEKGIAEDIERTAEAYARQRKATEDAIEAQRRYQDSVRETAEGVSDFIKDLAGGKGLDAALKSFGSKLTDQAFDGLLTGKGAIGTALGLAPTTKGGTGGLIGALLGQDTGFFKKMTSAVEAGSSDGIFSSFGSLFGAGKPLQGPTPSGATLDAGGLGGMGGLALGGLGGAVAGYSSGSPIMGALSGAMMGFAAAGPPGAIVGAIAGVIGGAIGGNANDKKRRDELRKQAEENYQQAAPQIASLSSQFRGDPQGTLAQRIAEAEAAQKKLGDVAYLSGRIEEQNKLFADFVTYKARTFDEFRGAYAGMLDALSNGLGPDSPFNKTRDTVKALGDSLKVFVEDTKTVFGEGSGQVDQSRNAARAYALQVLDGSKSLSVVATRMEEIRGAGVGLQQVLSDLGVSAADAAAAIEAATTAALARLKTSFETDLTRKTFDAQDKGYLNEAADLIAELASLRADATALGTNQGLVTDYFKASAQSIVDGAQLTGDAFDDLIRRFPELNGNVRAFEEAIDAASKAAEIASRRLGYQDRLFAALNDTDTLAGQLAAYDRTAMREREEEIKAGGEAILDLENAQLVERYKIIRDFNEAANDNYRQSLEQQQDYIARFARSIREYLDGLRAGSDSPLSPQARLAAAQSQYNAQLALAQGGNRDALDGITSYASDLLSAAKGFYASSSGFQAIFAQIQSQLGALPSQVSPEQFIVNAINAASTAEISAMATMRDTLRASVDSGSASQIAAALSTYFNKIDTNTDNTISFAEMSSALGGMASNQALRDMFTRLDTDNSGSLSRLELIKNATGQTEAYSFQQKQTLDYLANVALVANNLQSSANSIADFSNNLGISQNDILRAIEGLQGTSAAQLQLLNSQLSTQTNVTVQGQSVYGNLVDNMRKVVYNTALANQRFSVQGNSPSVNYTFAQGGLVEGPGTGTSDSISARLSNGEYVLRAAAVDRFGVGLLDRMNDNFAMPAMAVPVPVSGGGDMREVVSELKAVKAELAALRSDTRAGASLVATETRGVKASVESGNALASDNNKHLRRGKAA